MVGGGAREHALAAAVARSGGVVFAALRNRNPGILRLAREHALVSETDAARVVEWARKWGVDVAVLGMDASVEAGVGDALVAAGVRVASPSRAAGEIEWSKAFMRRLLEVHDVPGRVRWRLFDSLVGVREFVDELGDVVVKPVGLTGGKGVKVMGDHLASREEAVAYAGEVLLTRLGGAEVIVEERLVGEEFSLQAFSDGRRLAFMPAVQDHKRAFEGDRGPNTGGMGAYSDADGSLPFLRSDDLERARGICQRIVDALRAEGRPFVGALYGQFMVTRDGPRVIEVNARFGDPEAMNVLEVLDSSFVDVLEGMASGSLSASAVRWRPLATVCKYVVPEGYGVRPMANEPLRVDEARVAAAGASCYFAAVNELPDGSLSTTSSRAVGVVAAAPSIEEAEARVERALPAVWGPHLFARHDIGKRELVERRVAHMRELRGE